MAVNHARRPRSAAPAIQLLSISKRSLKIENWGSLLRPDLRSVSRPINPIIACWAEIRPSRVIFPRSVCGRRRNCSSRDSAVSSSSSACSFNTRTNSSWIGGQPCGWLFAKNCVCSIRLGMEDIDFSNRSGRLATMSLQKICRSISLRPRRSQLLLS